jgi:hypothetical protein
MTVFRENLKELKTIWDNLDDQLKECALDPFEFTNRKGFVITLNEVGMSQLIQHLDKHGFEIRKKL